MTHSETPAGWRIFRHLFSYGLFRHIHNHIQNETFLWKLFRSCVYLFYNRINLGLRVCLCFCRFTVMDPLSEHQTRFWMDKAVQWGQATSPSAQQDISQHMQSLGTFLQQLVHTLQTMVIASVMPFYSRDGLLLWSRKWYHIEDIYPFIWGSSFIHFRSFNLSSPLALFGSCCCNRLRRSSHTLSQAGLVHLRLNNTCMTNALHVAEKEPTRLCGLHGWPVGLHSLYCC